MADLGFRFLDEAIALMPTKEMSASLYCGFTGVAWVAQHLAELWGDSLDPSIGEDVDAAILGCLQEEGDTAPYDLIDGLVGIGLYFVSRLPERRAERGLRLLLSLLEARAVRERHGCAWRTGSAERGHYNLGLSHGVPGVIALLGHLYRIGVEPDRARALAEEAVTWLLAQRIDDEAGMYPGHVIPGTPGVPTRLAWCYGDPGVACALLAAARQFGRSDWEQAALAAAHRAAERPVDGSGVVDVGLCHGASGLGLVFQHLWNQTGDALCARAGRRWFERCLALRGDPELAREFALAPELGSAAGREVSAGEAGEDRDIAGFSIWSYERQREGEYIADPCFLTGVAGLGLALLAAATDAAPTWARVMLVEPD